MVTSSDIGKLKLEDEIKKGIFIGGKTYCFITNNKELVCKAKGVKSSKLKYTHYLHLLSGVDIKATNIQSKGEWVKGGIKI